MGETERRREKQLGYNERHGIIPKGVVKRVKDIIDGVYDAKVAQRELKAAQEKAGYEHMTEKQLTREVKRLEKEMNEYARNLEFEKAAATRDLLFRVKAQLFGAETHDSGV